MLAYIFTYCVFKYAQTLLAPPLMTPNKALVWFKRDLRVRDHAPLAEAMHFESAVGLVVIEPQWLQSPECDARHVAFLLDCVAQLRDDLAARGLPLLVRTGDMQAVLHTLWREWAFTHLFSHEETGSGCVRVPVGRGDGRSA